MGLKAYLTDIANAIRHKNGTSDNYLVSQMASAIENIDLYKFGSFTVTSNSNASNNYLYKAIINGLDFNPSHFIAYCMSPISSITKNTVTVMYYIASTQTISGMYIQYNSSATKGMYGLKSMQPTISGEIKDEIQEDGSVKKILYFCTGTGYLFKSNWRYIAWQQ